MGFLDRVSWKTLHLMGMLLVLTGGRWSYGWCNGL